jgi:GR25 family glycosyltransferase involved in LPS biosynthesis
MPITINLNELPICVINLPERTQRLERTIIELNKFYDYTKEFTIVEGVRHKQPMIGIAQSHMNAVKLAKDNNWPAVLIIEDDVKFIGTNPKLYADNIFNNVPNDAQILLGGIYTGVPIKTTNYAWNEIKEFSALHFYVVLSSAYYTFLSFKELTPQHIDRALAKDKSNYGLGIKSYVASEFFAIQYSGFSDNQGKDMSYDHLLKKYKLLK